MLRSILLRAALLSTLTMAPLAACMTEEPLGATEAELGVGPPSCDPARLAAYNAARAAVEAALSREAQASATIAIQRQVLATSSNAAARALATQLLAQATVEHTAAQVARVEAQLALHTLGGYVVACLGICVAWVQVGGTAQAAEWCPPQPTSTLECMAAEAVLADLQQQLTAMQAAAAANEAQCAAGIRSPETCAELRTRYAQSASTLRSQIDAATAAFESCIANHDPDLPGPGQPQDPSGEPDPIVPPTPEPSPPEPDAPSPPMPDEPSPPMPDEPSPPMPDAPSPPVPDAPSPPEPDEPSPPMPD